jgi:hypothetical protein
MNESETLQLSKALIARASVTPEDAGCQAMLAERLEKLNLALSSNIFVLMIPIIYGRVLVQKDHCSHSPGILMLCRLALNPNGQPLPLSQ